MHTKSLATLVLLAALSIAPAHAEERFPAGGISIDEKAQLTIAREDVYLSVREVRVHYEYRSDVPQTITMRFENPVVPIDGSPDHLGGALLDEGEDHTNYMRLSIKADGTEVTPRVREAAYFNGEDITTELADAGIPAYLATWEDLRDALARLDPAKRDALVGRGIVIVDEYGDPAVPAWQYRTVLEWEQEMAVGTTSVDIAYQPLNGYPSGVDPAHYGEGDDEAYVEQVRAFYCLDDAFYRAVAKKREAIPHFEIVELGFSMSQEDRARPIEVFTLTVDKADTAEGMEDMTFVAFCPAEARKISDTQFRWSAENFTPSRDIDVAFYAFMPGS